MLHSTADFAFLSISLSAIATKRVSSLSRLGAY